MGVLTLEVSAWAEHPDGWHADSGRTMDCFIPRAAEIEVARDQPERARAASHEQDSTVRNPYRRTQ